jgi:hypothetical protein
MHAKQVSFVTWFMNYKLSLTQNVVQYQVRYIVHCGSVTKSQSIYTRLHGGGGMKWKNERS